GHPVLRAPARELTRQEVLSPDLQRLMDDMVGTMRDADGLGLAAPQVYEGVRLLVTEVRSSRPDDPEEPAMPLMVLANPTIVKASKQMADGWEGCLSIPDIRGMVPRHQAITVDALDRQARPVMVDLKGFFARVIQHEIDHLDGVLFLDRMK